MHMYKVKLVIEERSQFEIMFNSQEELLAFIKSIVNSGEKYEITIITTLRGWVNSFSQYTSFLKL